MDKMKRLCRVNVFDGDRIGITDDYLSSLNERNEYGSKMILHHLQNYAATINCTVEIPNQSTFEDHWVIEFKTAENSTMDRLILSLQKYFSDYTEWAVWAEVNESYKANAALRYLGEKEGVSVEMN